VLKMVVHRRFMEILPQESALARGVFTVQTAGDLRLIKKANGERDTSSSSLLVCEASLHVSTAKLIARFLIQFSHKLVFSLNQV
jgi:hypothetical protein